ncbi:MAG: PAS domain S-box protein [Victivallales bacterium]|nr:PAS domain S-box protein [Victivallales bacterium]
MNKKSYFEKYSWLFEKKEPVTDADDYQPYYGDVTELNSDGILKNNIDKEVFKDIAKEVLKFLDTSLAVYEKNGDYAFGILASEWCRFLDKASRKLCGDIDNREVLKCGKWLCHECCWHENAEICIRTEKPVDIECVGGLNLYAEPIFVNGKVAGVINIGYGDPPSDEKELTSLAKKFNVKVSKLKKQAENYKPRPDFLIELAKDKLKLAAKLIGRQVELSISSNKLRKKSSELEELLKASPDALIFADLDRRITKVNTAFIKLYGYTEKEVYGNKTSMLYHNKKDFVEQGKKRYNPNAVVSYKSYEVLYRKKNGKTFIGATIGGIVIDEQGKPIGLVASVRDVTEKKNREDEIIKANRHAMYMLAVASEYRDRDTGEHINRIGNLTKKISLKLGIEPDEAERIRMDSSLHDIGKIGIPDSILLKKGKLSVEEFELMKQHSTIGAKIIGEDKWFRQARGIALYHHEKWNGKGYPEGLKGGEIPLAARIVALSDVYDALISERPYKNAWTKEQAIKEIRSESGKHFDPEVVKAFIKVEAATNEKCRSEAGN